MSNIVTSVLIIYDKVKYFYAYTSNTMIGDIEYFKTVSCDDKYAEVYYVCKYVSCENVLTFLKDKNKWNYDSWQNTICSVW